MGNIKSRCLKKILASCLVIILVVSYNFGNKALGIEGSTDNNISKYNNYLSLLSRFQQDKLGNGLDPYLPTGVEQEQAETFGLVLSAEAIKYLSNPNEESKERINQAVSWLLDNSDADNDGLLGWGLPGAWDAFGDGTKNPENSQFTITNVLVIQGLLDAMQVPDLLSESQVVKIQNIIKEISLYYCRYAWTDTEDGGFFWYSPSKNDAHFVPNVSSMFMGMLCRVILEQNQLFTEGEKYFIFQKIDKSALAIINKVIWREGLPYWNYIVKPNIFNQDEPNDLVHHGYILWGMELFRNYKGHSSSPLTWTTNQAIQSLNSFWRNGLLYDCPQNTIYYGDQSIYNDRPANLWGAGMMMAFTAKYGFKEDSDRCREYINQVYGPFPNLRLWPKDFSSDDNFYPRYTSHVLWGLVLNSFTEPSRFDSTIDTRLNLYNPKKKIVEQPFAVLAPYLWGQKSDQQLFSDNRINDRGAASDQLILSLETLQLLQSGYSENDQAKLLMAKQNISNIINNKAIIKTADRISWIQPAYEDIPEGWWSCMDNAIIAITMQAAYEVFGDKSYQVMAKQVTDSMLLAPKKGGSLLWLDDKKCWLSEYTWPSMSVKDEYFVLNGCLFALQALKIMADRTGDANYNKIYEATVEGYKSLESKFNNSQEYWTWYMLNPRTVNQTHYHIYETIQLDALYIMTGNIFFKEQADKHRSILAKAFPVYCINYENNHLFALLPRIGTPYFYTIDTYPIRVMFMDEDNKVLKVKYSTNASNLNICERGFISESIPLGLSKYQVYSIYNGNTFLLYEAAIQKSQIKMDSLPTSVSFKITGILDAQNSKESNRSVIVFPAIQTDKENPNNYQNKQGRIVVDLEQAIDHKSIPYVGFNLFTSYDINIGIDIIDQENRTAFTYYLPLKGEKNNLVLLNWLGFTDIDKLSTTIKGFNIYIYTDKLEKQGVDKVTVKVNDVLAFPSQVEIYNYLTQNKNVYFPEQN